MMETKQQGAELPTERNFMMKSDDTAFFINLMTFMAIRNLKSQKEKKLTCSHAAQAMWKNNL